MNRKWWLVSAASAVLALTAAACGSSNSSSSRALRHLAGAGSSAQQAAQEAWTAKFEDQNSGATISYDPIGSGGGRDQFIAGGNTAFAGSDSPLRHRRSCRRRHSAASRRPAGPDPELHLADRGRLQPAGVDSLQLDPGYDREDLQGRDHDLERPRHQGGQPRREPAQTRRSPRCIARMSQGPRRTSRTTSIGRAERLDVRPGRHLAAEDRRVRRPDLRCDRRRSRPATARSATPTTARPAASASPRSRSATRTWRRALRARPTTSTSRRRTRS